MTFVVPDYIITVWFAGLTSSFQQSSVTQLRPSYQYLRQEMVAWIHKGTAGNLNLNSSVLQTLGAGPECRPLNKPSPLSLYLGFLKTLLLYSR